MTDPSSAYELLAISVRKLIDATIRTELQPSVIASTAAEIDAITRRLRSEQMPGSFGQRARIDGQSPASGNAVIGVRNPSAPPLMIHDRGNGSVCAEVVLGAAYEGPAGYVHGGVCAMLLDHILGATAHKPGRPAYTGTLTLRYHRGTPLRTPLQAEAWIDHVEVVKTFAAGQLSDGQGVTVSAEGVFIHRRH